MRRRNLARVAYWSAGLLFLTGCARQDADVLARIGQKLWERAQSVNVTDTTNKLARSMPLPRTGDGDELERRVESRLRADPALTSLRVRTEGGQVKLCGRVRDEDERRRALSLAEEAAGAGKVIDALEGP
jgi:osmotically-inducible protein OsmY